MFRRPFSFADTEARENHAQEVVGGEFAGDFAARGLGEAQVFGQQLDLVVAAAGGVFQLGLRGFEGGGVAAAGEEQSFAFALPADLLQQGTFEQIQARAGFGRQADKGVRAAFAAKDV